MKMQTSSVRFLPLSTNLLLRRKENASQPRRCKMFPTWGTAYCERIINKIYNFFPSHVCSPTRISVSDMFYTMLYTLSHQTMLQNWLTFFWLCRCRIKFDTFKPFYQTVMHVEDFHQKPLHVVWIYRPQYTFGVRRSTTRLCTLPFGK